MLLEEEKLKEGYVMRPVEMEDSPAVVDFFREYCQLAGDNDEPSLSDIQNFWKTPGLNLQDDLRLVHSPEGKIVAYVEALAFSDPPNHPWLWLRLHPDEKDPRVGEAAVDWALRRLNRVLAVVPAELRVSISTFNLNGYKPVHELFESRGFKLIRHAFHMGIELDKQPAAPVWPEGITLRPFDAEQHAEEVYRGMEEAFRDHFGFQPQPFETDFPRWKHQMMEDKEAFDPDLWLIAMDGDEMAGGSLCRTLWQGGRQIGWVEDLGVRRPWRKRGLGTALLLHSFAEFYRRGLPKAGLGVDASNLTGALQLYERAGMQVDTRYDRYEKELRSGKELMTTELTH